MTVGASALHVWICEIGEPLPFLAGHRLLRYGELSRILTERGHKLTWWGCDFSHQTRSFVGPANRRIESDGATFVLVHGPGYRRNVGPGRLRHVSMHAANLRKLLRHAAPPNVIVSGMPTIEACDVLAEYARRHAVPLLVDVRDEWPEDYVRWLPKPLRSLGRLILAPKFRALRRVCHSATALIAVTERQLHYALRNAGRARHERDAVFYTGARRTPLDRAAVSAEVLRWRARGIGPHEFVCAFAGTMSASRPLDAFIAATQRLADRIPIKLVLAGRGDHEPRYRALVGNTPNIMFAGWLNAVELAALNEVADVLLAPYSSEYGFSLPTKIFDYLAAGRALVSSCPGEAEHILRKENVALQVDVNDIHGIEAAIGSLWANPEERHAMGARARALFEREFTLEAIVNRYADHIERLTSASGRGVAA